MSTIENHQSDESASTRIAVWQWTLDYAGDHPMGGGFNAYLGNEIRYEAKSTDKSGNLATVDSREVTDKSRAYHSSYFEMLGEQGWPGLFLWLWLQLSGLWQMERIRWRWKKRGDETAAWAVPLAGALQHAQLVYLLGSVFVGIAFQPFMLMIIGLQCALWSYLRRIDAPIHARPSGVRKLSPLAPLAPPAAPDPEPSGLRV